MRTAISLFFLLTYCINSSRSRIKINEFILYFSHLLHKFLTLEKKSKLFLSRLIGIFVPLSPDVCNDIFEQYAKLSKIFTKI